MDGLRAHAQGHLCRLLPFAAGSEAEAFKRRLLQEAEVMLTRYRNNKENENLRRQAKRAVKLKAALSSGKNDPEAQLLADEV